MECPIIWAGFISCIETLHEHPERQILLFIDVCPVLQYWNGFRLPFHLRLQWTIFMLVEMHQVLLS
jgi:hypothetical protein